MSALAGVEPFPAIYAALVLFSAYLVRGIAGFGSGLIAVPLLSLAFPVPSVVPLVVALDYVGSLSQGVENLRRVAWKEQLALLPFMVVGVGLGLLVFRTLAAGVPRQGARGLRHRVCDLPDAAPSGAARIAVRRGACGVLGGLVGTLFGTGGPFYVIYFNLRKLTRRTSSGPPSPRTSSSTAACA